MSTEPCHKVLSPTAILGYGFPEESFRRGLEKHPDLIGVDAGSTDPGPYYLGSGTSFTSRAGVKRDLALILEAALEAGIPCIIGSAGGSGAREHVNWAREIIQEIARERGLRFRMAVISADFSRDMVTAALDAGRISSLFPAPDLTRADIEGSTRIVGQMGAEPVLAALREEPDLILCGRAYDPVVFAAPAIGAGFDPGLALHMGKILECAAIAATPGSGSDCVLGSLYEDAFVLESLNPARAFTSVSTAAHTLYEKSDPYSLPGPGGTLDLHMTRFEELGGGRVRVTGSRYVPAPVYTIKLEGAGKVGYRTISIAGIRDPLLISQIHDVLATIEGRATRDLNIEGRVLFHVYGRDGVMGPREPERERASHELGLVIEAVAATQAEADSLCSSVRSTLLHFGYPGRMATAGNLALLYSPSDIACGEVFEFTIYHLLEVDDPVAPFPIEYCEVGP